MKTSLAQRQAMKRWRRKNRAKCRVHTYKSGGLCYIRHCHSIKGLLNYEKVIKKRLNDLGYNPKDKKAVTN